MPGPYTRLLDALIGLVFTRLILVCAVLVTMALAWRGHYLPAAGMAVAIAYFFYLYWGYVRAGDVPEPYR